MTTQTSALHLKTKKFFFLPWVSHVRRVGLALATTLLIGSSAQAASTDTWVGPSGDDWSVTGDWSLAKPGASDTALFNSNISSVTNAVADQAVSSISFGTGAGSITIGSKGGNKLLLSSGGTTQLLNTLTGTGLTETINSPVVIASGAGAATYAFSNAYTDNTSTLVIGGAVSGGTTGTTTLTLSGVNTGANTVSGAITNGSSSALSITKSGTGTWVLSGNNTYSGGTNISGGTLDINSSTALGTGAFAATAAFTIDNTSGSSITLGNNTFNFNTMTFGGSNNLTFGTGAVSLNQNTDSITLGGTNSSLVFGGVVTDTASATNITVTVNGSGNTLTLGGYNISSGAALKNLTIGGTGNVNITGTVADSSSTGVLSTLTYSGTGKLLLTGANTYTGKTAVGTGTTASTLQFGKEVSFYNGNTASWTVANLLVNSKATLALNVGGTGEFTASDVSKIVALGTSSGGFQAGSAIGLDTTNASGGSFTYSNVIANTNSNANAIGLTKLGSGNLVLASATGSTYTGGTKVTAGGLIVNNTSGSATGSGAVDVQTNALLGGGNSAANSGALVTLGTLGHIPTSQVYASGVNGLITGLVTIENGAHLAPGNNNVGTLTTASLTFSLGAIADYQFNGTANSFTAVTGALTLNGGGFNLYQEGTTNAFATAGTYDLMSYGSLTGSISVGSLTVLNAQAGFNYTFINDTTDDQIQLEITGGAVPEPSTWAMMVGGLVLLVVWQRRRHEV